MILPLIIQSPVHLVMSKFYILRNSFLAKKGFATPKTTKTGTTICGAVFNGGVVLGADTRSTSGEIVADKNCMKIHDLAPNMVSS